MLARFDNRQCWSGQCGHEELTGVRINSKGIRIFWGGQGFHYAVLGAVDHRDAVTVRVGDVHAVFADVQRDGLRSVADFNGGDHQMFDGVDHGDSVIAMIDHARCGENLEQADSTFVD